MKEYYFLFALAFLWTTFAVVQDLKKREVSNWLNFSFVAIALSYRTFFSLSTKNYNFLIFGLVSFLIFFVFAHIFYYTRTFAGGDAKLLIGFGTILPYTIYKDLLITPLIFLFVLFLFGAVYSLVYSIFIVAKNKQKFKKEFSILSEKQKILQIFSASVFIISIGLSFYNLIFLFFVVLSLIPITYLYTKSLDKCMLAILPPEKLTEGDWLEKEVKIGKTVIKKSVHGLSLEEIKILKKHKKSVLIKTGIPFVPVFLLTLIFMVFFFSVLKLPLESLFSFLF